MTTLPNRTSVWNWLGRRKDVSIDAPSARFAVGRVRRIFAECVSEIGGEASARARAATLATIYRGLDDGGKRGFLSLLAMQAGAADVSAAPLVDDFLKSSGAAHRLAALRLRAVLAGASLRILRQFNLLEDGVKFLVDLRADALRLANGDAELSIIDEELLALFRDWFALGNLELRRISWDSPAALLERLMAYEAVHEIRSWADLRHRLQSDRRCYAFFHPRMPEEPLVFVEVALMQRVASSIDPLLDETAPACDPHSAGAAVFYSISSTQTGLRGVSFGGFLIKRVVENLLGEFPRLATFATLSPVPRFRRWLDARVGSGAQLLLSDRNGTGRDKGARNRDPEVALQHALAGDLPVDRAATAALEAVLLPLCARYLVLEKEDGLPIDPVARFHFGNGARLDRLNWLANTSSRGLQESLGIMVNYVYEPSEIEENHEAYFRDGKVATSAGVRRLLRKGLNGAGSNENSSAP
ncbi:MAG TPA: malonyl-CoA decarboxylase family protein [Casimicrobiaceae bacterium]|nr:malonyl-CoA decarboxylase family protein [Casimicrobiaceae bacterium]